MKRMQKMYILEMCINVYIIINVGVPHFAEKQRKKTASEVIKHKLE